MRSSSERLRNRLWAAGSISAAACAASASTDARRRAQTFQGAFEGDDHVRVELRAGAASQLGQALAIAQRASIGPLAGHGVVAVHHAHRPGDQRDRLAGQAVGVALSVETFVVVAHPRHELVVEQGAHDLGADAGVLAHELPLFGRQRPGLEQHAVGDADLADVVQEGDVAHLLEAIRGPVQLGTQQGHVGGHPAGVAEGVVILGRQRRAQGPQVAQVKALDLFVELGVLEGQGDELTDRFGRGRLVLCEDALDVVEQVDDADDLVAGHQGQRDEAALTVVAHVAAHRLVQRRMVEAVDRHRTPQQNGESLAGPLVEVELVAHPGRVVDTVERGGQAGQAPVTLDPVDVAVGDRESRAQAPRGELQDLAQIEGRSQLDARVEQELIALVGAVGPCVGSTVANRPDRGRHEIVGQKAALAARRTPARQPAAVGPATHGRRTDAQRIGGLLHAQPPGLHGSRSHRGVYRPLGPFS